MFVIISYDITDDKRRSRIFKALKNFGQWMQYSVFECDLEKMQFLKLKDRLDHLMAVYAAMVESIDTNVGELVAGLKARGISTTR